MHENCNIGNLTFYVFEEGLVCGFSCVANRQMFFEGKGKGK